MNPGTFYRTLRQMENDGMGYLGAEPALRASSITDAGETYVNFWADSLNQYQMMMETFSGSTPAVHHARMGRICPGSQGKK